MELTEILKDLSLSDESIAEEPTMAAFFKQIFQKGADNLDAIGASAPIGMLEPISALAQVGRIHGEKFAQIGGDTAVERFKSVMSYFAYSAMVISSHNSKKPLNPIISEVFTCAYSPKGEWSADAPVHVLIEQVSHHPPINAMRIYSKASTAALESVQHYDFKLGKGFYFILKSRGYANVFLEKWNESYHVKLPNFIIQPKLAMNGSADILMTGTLRIESSSGLVGEIKYEEKSFLRSLGSSVSGFIAKKESPETVLVNIEGDWKSEILFKESSKVSLAASSKECPRIRGFSQVVRPKDDLEPTHTYKVWNPVTDAMQSGDMKNARKRKGKLENWQREYLKSIKENYQPRFFKNESENWKWNPPSKEYQDIYGLPISST